MLLNQATIGAAATTHEPWALRPSTKGNLATVPKWTATATESPASRTGAEEEAAIAQSLPLSPTATIPDC